MEKEKNFKFNIESFFNELDNFIKKIKNDDEKSLKKLFILSFIIFAIIFSAKIIGIIIVSLLAFFYLDRYFNKTKTKEESEELDEV